MNAVFMLVVALAAFAIPIAAAILWCRKTKTGIRPVLIGAAIFFLFVNVLESLLHSVVLTSGNAVSQYIMSHTFLYGLYGGLAAGLFEETGRFFAFRTLLKKYEDRRTAVSYGIGHGGMEFILVLGVNYLVMSVLLLSAGTKEGTNIAELLPAIESMTPPLMLVALWERIFAFILQIALSVFVFEAARDKEKIFLYPLSILLHALIDFCAVLYSGGFAPLWMMEALIAVYSLTVAYFAWKRYKRI